MAQLAAERAFDCTRAMDRKSKAKHCLAVAQTLKVTSLSSAESCAREVASLQSTSGQALRSQQGIKRNLQTNLFRHISAPLTYCGGAPGLQVGFL